ncbi:hypothetical protein HZH66_012748 [Vespula vulgaris]|uniref:Uncharacterized protein n=1 Tax=Vespula vulgaris TaxID=7454 RepID=A0A834J7L7_VESVU|nr:hypothetical protein HZH66_012748 [Vespula vulgaris]
MRGSERSLRTRNPKRQHFGRSQDSTGFGTRSRDGRTETKAEGERRVEEDACTHGTCFAFLLNLHQTIERRASERASERASKQACFSILWEVLPPDGGGDSATSLYPPCLTPLPHISLQAESPTAETNAFSRDSIP